MKNPIVFILVFAGVTAILAYLILFALPFIVHTKAVCLSRGFSGSNVTITLDRYCTRSVSGTTQVYDLDNEVYL